jgi:ParB family chromosome partitioning protein
MERRLGRGLGSLLSEAKPQEASSEIELDLIRANPFQPRKVFDAEGLEELRDSIRIHGLLQPIVVRRAGQGFELVSGERRCRASRMAGLMRIPAIVRESVTDSEMLELALVENVQRKDLDPLERARGFQALMENLKLTQEQVATKVGLKRATVANHLRLLELPSKAQEALAKGLVTMGHARALLGVANPARCVALLEETIRKDLSVRAVEERVRQLSIAKPSPGGPFADRTPPKVLVPWAADLQRRMQDSLGTKVTIEPGEGQRGRIVIEYFSRSDLDRLIERLAPDSRI